MSEQAIALKVLIRQRHMSYEAFCREWDRTSKDMDDALKGRFPGRAQYYRWLRGDLAHKRPYPDACRMLEAMFRGWSVEKLFSPYAGESPPSEASMPSSAESAAFGNDGLPSEKEVLQIPSAGAVAVASHVINISGEWWASWQTFRDGVQKIATQQVECKQSGDIVQVATLTHGLSAEEGGYHWNGELRLWDNEILMGWYAAAEGPVRSKGTMYFALHPHGLHMTGRWVGLGYDERIMSGWGSMAKTREAAEVIIDRLNHGLGKIGG